MENDFQGMYKQELYERKNYQYPPFFKMVKLTVRHKEKEMVDRASAVLVRFLKDKLGNRVLGPEYPSIARVRNVYNKIITIKFERKASSAKVKEFINDKLIDLKQDKDYKSVRVKIDVDPI